MTRQALLIFTKNPEAGKVKTRLAATLGNEAALTVYKELLACTAAATDTIPLDKFVVYSSYIDQKDLWSDRHYQKLLQTGNDLGEKMNNAFSAAFERGYHSVGIIGTDCPDLTGEIMMNAFAQLHTHDVVIGPAQDGGYYLLGMKQLHSHLFENMLWSTNTVLEETLKRCDVLRLTYHLLTELNDIDEAHDLEVFRLRNQ